MLDLRKLVNVEKAPDRKTHKLKAKDCESVDKMTVTQLKQFLTDRNVELPAAYKRKAHYVQMAHDICPAEKDKDPVKTKIKKRFIFSKETKNNDGSLQAKKIDNRRVSETRKKVKTNTAQKDKRPVRKINTPAKLFTIDDFDNDDDDDDDDYEPSDE